MHKGRHDDIKTTILVQPMEYLLFIKLSCATVSTTKLEEVFALWSMWMCCLCGLDPVVVGFRPVFS
jgi:hypothetical protein